MVLLPVNLLKKLDVGCTDVTNAPPPPVDMELALSGPVTSNVLPDNLKVLVTLSPLTEKKSILPTAGFITISAICYINRGQI